MEGKSSNRSISQIVNEIKEPCTISSEAVNEKPVEPINEESSSQTESEELNNEQKSPEDQVSIEKDKRLQLERKIELILASEKEKEEAIKLLEKDIYEKQDTIISLGRQIEDIKTVNIQLTDKMKESETKVKSKLELISTLEHRNTVLDTTLCQLSEK